MPSRFKNAKPYIWPTLEEVRAERLQAQKNNINGQPSAPRHPPLPHPLTTSPSKEIPRRSSPSIVDLHASSLQPSPAQDLGTAALSSQGKSAGIGDWE